jgi:hypothetical protein
MSRTLLLSLLALGLLFVLAACDAGVEGDDSAPGVSCEGDYLVDAADTAADVSLVENCAVITGGLRIEGTSLANVDSLSKLTSVGDYLEINGNSALTNLDGLSNLTSVGGALAMYDNDALTNLDGLSNLAAAVGSVLIDANPALTNIDGLSNLTSVGDYLEIYENAALCQDSVDAVVAACTIGGTVTTTSNNGTCP